MAFLSSLCLPVLILVIFCSTAESHCSFLNSIFQPGFSTRKMLCLHECEHGLCKDRQNFNKQLVCGDRIELRHVRDSHLGVTDWGKLSPVLDVAGIALRKRFTGDVLDICLAERHDKTWRPLPTISLRSRQMTYSTNIYKRSDDLTSAVQAFRLRFAVS